MVDRSEVEYRREWPVWLIGLAVAAVVFAGFLFAFHVLGFGDTPTIEGLGPEALTRFSPTL